MRSCFNSSNSLPALLVFSLPESPMFQASQYSLDCCLTCSSSMELTIRSCFNSSNSLPALLVFSLPESPMFLVSQYTRWIVV